MKNRIEISCESCKYFERHYALFDGEFKKIGCGHCSNGALSPRKRSKCPRSVNCRQFSLRIVQSDSSATLGMTDNTNGQNDI